MSNDEWKNIAAIKAIDVCQLMEIPSDSVNILNAEQTPGQFIDSLVERHKFSLAVQFLSYALPKREAVWWATQCIHSVEQENTVIKILREACEAAEQWVKNPTEDNRLACGQAAESSGYNGPSGLVAMAAFFSSGSMAPPGYPAVEPQPDLTPKMVSAALTLAALQPEPEKADKNYQHFFELGLSIAKGEL